MADSKPRTSFGRLLDDLGATLLELAYGDAPNNVTISSIVIHDPLDEPDLPAGALVLGNGLRDPDEIASLLHRLGRQRAAGLVLRAPVPVNTAVAAAAESSGVAVLGLTRGASWAQLVAIARSLLAEDVVGGADAESLGGLPSGDLFAIANAISTVLDAPVTIEDRGSRVLAFSGRQDEADRSRIETILGRHVPERTTQMLASRGIFRAIYRSDAPVWQDPLEPDQLPRVAIAVRAGDEVLGSIWAATEQPLTEERARALVDAAKITALHLLHMRAGTDVQRRVRTDLLSTALEGGAGAPEALHRLGLAEQAVIVLALAVPDHGGIGVRADVEAERQRLADAFAMHLAAMHPRCATALIEDIAYGLLPVSRDATDLENRALRVANDFLARTAHHGRAVIGIGPLAHGVAGLAHARASADRVVRVLSARPGTGPRVATLPDVRVDAVLLEMRDLITARGDRPAGPIPPLMAYDERHRSQLVETLHAWLDAFGDINAAAAAVGVHPNTFRYRLRRVGEVGDVDLTDPEARFAAMLDLRIALAGCARPTLPYAADVLDARPAPAQRRRSRPRMRSAITDPIG